jgi:cell wall-associated NlpC family hydrolase
MNRMYLARTPLVFLLLLVIGMSMTSCKAKMKAGGSTTVVNSPAKKEMAFRQGIIDRAKEYVGTGYKYAGRSPQTGFDCSGFTSFVLGQYEVKVSPASRTQATEGQAVPLDKVKAGDLVFFSSAGKGGRVTHVAMVVDHTEEGIFVIHSTNTRGVIVENITTSRYWKPKILFARDVITPQNPLK